MKVFQWPPIIHAPFCINFSNFIEFIFKILYH